MEASVRDQKHFTAAGRIRKPADVGQEFLRSWNIEFSTPGSIKSA